MIALAGPLVSLAVVASGCAPSPSLAPGDDRPVVVAAVYPLGYAASRVVGDLAQVDVLVPPGTEPHDYELSGRQVASLRSATLVVYQAGLDAALDQAVTQAAHAVVETGSLVTLRPSVAGVEDPSNAYGYDPHTWLDPTYMATFAAAIATEMGRLDPARAAAYQANATAFQADLTSLDADYRTGLTGCRTSTFLTTHAAFGYLADRYNLTQLAIAGVGAENEPSPKHLGELAVQARTHGLTTVFFETLLSPDYATTLADDLGLRTDVLDPIEGVTASSRGSDYLAIMRANLAALKQANGCTR